MGNGPERDSEQATANPWQTRSVTRVYDNPWIEVSHHAVVKPSGGDGIYGVVRFKNLALGVVPLDDQGNTWLVGQYRYPLDRYSWEIPEGGGPPEVPALESAQRELREETGIKARVWTHLLNMHLSNSVTDESAIAYVAQGLEFGAPEPDDTEHLVVRRVRFADAVAMVLAGEITDALSVAALLKTNEWLRSGRIAFVAD
ncbi:MAG: NUDIX domain-containing protein [Pseudomonadales bacterium]